MQRQGLRSYSWFVRFALVFQKLPGLDLWLLEIVCSIHSEKRTVGYNALWAREYGTVGTWIDTLFGGSQRGGIRVHHDQRQPGCSQFVGLIG